MYSGFFKVVVGLVFYAGCLSMMTHTPALTTPGAEVVIENESKAVDDNCYVSHNLNSNQS